MTNTHRDCPHCGSNAVKLVSETPHYADGLLNGRPTQYIVGMDVTRHCEGCRKETHMTRPLTDVEKKFFYSHSWE